MILMCPHPSRPTPNQGPSCHKPVLMQETLAALAPERGGLFVDVTVGGGGHSEKILAASESVRLIAVDRDEQALERARTRLSVFGDRVTFVHAPFSSLASLIPAEWVGNISGILADFGVSSDQLEDRERGFSFQEDGPLDMRMDRTKQKTSAAVLCARASEDVLETWLREFGEERYSRRVAHAIVMQRRVGPLLRTSQLAELVSRTVSRGRQGIHPATRTFQALRIAVNRELDEVDAFLSVSPALLGVDGRLAVISFHSLEDRRAKRALRNEARSREFEDILKGGVTAQSAELRENPRSRSARLRAIRRVEALS